LVEIPDRTVTDRYMSDSGRTLDYSFDVDLGELIPGHRVVARGIGQAPMVPSSDHADLPQHVIDQVKLENQTPRDQVHFEHVPGLTRQSPTPDWSFTVSDDVDTKYSGVDEGAYDGHSGGVATHAYRELGGKIPPSATTLTLHFVPGYNKAMVEWHPPEPWTRELVIDLRSAGTAS
jgi:hypothetical protein